MRGVQSCAVATCCPELKPPRYNVHLRTHADRGTERGDGMCTSESSAESSPAPLLDEQLERRDSVSFGTRTSEATLARNEVGQEIGPPRPLVPIRGLPPTICGHLLVLH
jgi:hypothetical protein